MNPFLVDEADYQISDSGKKEKENSVSEKYW